MSALHLAWLVLLWLGVAIVVLSCVAMVAFRGVYAKLHAVAPATSLGALLIGVALALQSGPGHTGGKQLFTVVVLLVTGPVVAAATARAAHLRSGGRPPVTPAGRR